jgi:FtsH-binding integral membrane protein
MAIVDCPACKQRISSLAKVCPHCSTALAELSDEALAAVQRRRLDQQLFQVRNITYLAMAVALMGMIWWVFAGPDQTQVAAVLIAVGGLAYVAARAWMMWLQAQVNVLRKRQRTAPPD